MNLSKNKNKYIFKANYKCSMHGVLFFINLVIMLFIQQVYAQNFVRFSNYKDTPSLIM